MPGKGCKCRGDTQGCLRDLGEPVLSGAGGRGAPSSLSGRSEIALLALAACSWSPDADWGNLEIQHIGSSSAAWSLAGDASSSRVFGDQGSNLNPRLATGKPC